MPPQPARLGVLTFNWQTAQGGKAENAELTLT